jgi:hypothetical protein
MNCELLLTYDTPALWQTGSRNLRVQKRFPQYGIPIWSLWPNIRFLSSIVALRKMRRKMCIYKCMLNVYKNQQNRQTGSRNLMLTLLIFIHIEHICSFFIAFFSATIDGRNLIFGHKLHIGTPYRGKRFLTHQIPTSCLPILLIFIHI